MPGYPGAGNRQQRRELARGGGTVFEIHEHGPPARVRQGMQHGVHGPNVTEWIRNRKGTFRKSESHLIDGRELFCLRSRDRKQARTVSATKGDEEMQELMVDFIISLDGYASAEGWPGWWGLEGPEYLAWLGEQPERDYTILMGANTYRLMYGFVDQSRAPNSDLTADEDAATAELTNASKVVFSSTLEEPLSWANTRLVSGDAVEAVAAMKRDGASPMRTIGSLTLCRSAP